MGIIGLTKKPIFTINIGTAYYRHKQQGGDFSRKALMAPMGDRTMYLKSYKDLIDEVNNQKATLKPKDVLYFHSSSKFPRFKLQDSGFKRCIKLDKADAVVLGQNYCDQWIKNSSEYSTDNYDSYTVYEEANDYVMIENHDYYDDAFVNEFSSYGNNKFEIIENFYLDKDAVKIYDGQIIKCTSDNEEVISNIFNNIYPGILFDKDLDEIVSSNMESLTEESLNSITEMLESEDSSVVEMGLKLLSNYNVLEYKLTVKTILSLHNSKCSSNKCWNSAGIKQLRESLNYREPYTENIPGCFATLLSEGETYSDTDINLTKKIMHDYSDSKLNVALKGLKIVVSNFRLGININAE